MNQIIVFAIHILLKMVQELLKVIKDLTGFLLSQTISIAAFQILIWMEMEISFLCAFKLTFVLCILYLKSLVKDLEH